MAKFWLRGRVLDYGCGVGRLAAYVPPANYVGLDPDPESLDQARHTFPRHRFVTDFSAREKFDTIVALAVIEHLPDPLAFLEWASELLSQGGNVIITTPHRAFRRWHEWGARIGLFSSEAAHEHNILFDSRSFDELLAKSRLRVIRYARFLGGANQFWLLRSRLD